MNAKQKTILWILMGVIAAMMLFPPFHEPAGPGVMQNSGYGFLLSPPESQSGLVPSVNALQLIAQWIGAALIGGISWLLASGPQQLRAVIGHEAPMAQVVAAAAQIPLRGKRGVAQVLLEGMRRSIMWLCMCAAYALLPLVTVDDPHDMALKLVGNTGAALLVFLGVFSWNTVRVARGIAHHGPARKTRWVHLFAFTVLSVVLMFAGYRFMTPEVPEYVPDAELLGDRPDVAPNKP